MPHIPEPVAEVPAFPDSYGISDQLNETITWAEQRRKLEQSRNYWICTTRPDGRPHSAPVWGLWMYGTLYFATGRTSRKNLNLVRNASVSVHLESGDDVMILEGEVTEETDPDALSRFADLYEEKYSFRPDVQDLDGITYALIPEIGHSWLETDFPNTATKWVFKNE